MQSSLDTTKCSNITNMYFPKAQTLWFIHSHIFKKKYLLECLNAQKVCFQYFDFSVKKLISILSSLVNLMFIRYLILQTKISL